VLSTQDYGLILYLSIELSLDVMLMQILPVNLTRIMLNYGTASYHVQVYHHFLQLSCTLV